MKLNYSIIVFIFCYNASFAQVNKDCKVTIPASVINKITNSPIAGAKLTIINLYNSKDTSIIVSDKNGLFEPQQRVLQINDVLNIDFSAKGFISRNVVFDFRGIAKKDFYAHGWEIPLDMPLFPVGLDSDSSITNMLASIPSTRLSYNPTSGELDFDFIQIQSYNKLLGLTVNFYKRKKDSDSLKLIQFENEKILTKNQLELSSKRTQQYFLYGGIILVLIFAGFIYNRFKIARKQKLLIEHQKSLVEEKNREIMDSIGYAKRIQQSLLPSKKYIERILNRNK